MNPNFLFPWKRKKPQEATAVSVDPHDEKSIRSYLLGALSQSRAEQLEERMVRDEEFSQQVLLVEDELIEDFARGVLSTGENEKFLKHFLSTPRRRRKLMWIRTLRTYASEKAVSDIQQESSLPWYRRLLTPQLKAAALALLVLAATIGAWRVFVYQSPVERGLAALNEAFASERPLRSRVTGLKHGRFSVTRGGPSTTDQSALDRSTAILRAAVDDDPSAQTHHALGRAYLLRSEFDQAITEFEEALKTSPNNAELHSDLGAALLEKGKLEGGNRSEQGRATLARSLEHLNAALKLDDAMADARFNRALLYETLQMNAQALADWEKYLSVDPKSAWADEARTHIEALRTQR